MEPREIRSTPSFDRDLRFLAKKHRDVDTAAKAALTQIAGSEIPTDDLIPNLHKQPIYKRRIACGNRGKRGGARLIYYCSDKLVLALFIYAKSDQSDVPAKEILSALKDAGLIT